jgi:hydroxypyruvate reductase
LNPRELLIASFHAALAGVDPLRLTPPFLPAPPVGRTLVLGGGKAAASMARAVEMHWPAHAPLSGQVVTRYQHSMPTQRIAVIEASHPLPDGRGAAAAASMLAQATELTQDDLLLALISGGGSSLLALPVAGVTLKQLRQVTRALLRSGAPIEAINSVRKHLTQLAGGQLARAAGAATVHALILSDVVGDDPTHIGSGPCAPDPSTYADALEILTRYACAVPPAITHYLARGQAGELADTPKPGDACFARTYNQIIGNADCMLAAAAQFFQRHGIATHVVNPAETGDARQLALRHADLIRRQYATMARPVALLSGGETTVAVQGRGQGGRNSEYLLALSIALEGMNNAWALACDTDGIDGSANNAGALLSPTTLARGQAMDMNAQGYLENNDAYGFFSALNDLVITGPTRTNVNDYRVSLLI